MKTSRNYDANAKLNHRVDKSIPSSSNVQKVCAVNFALDPVKNLEGSLIITVQILNYVCF